MLSQVRRALNLMDAVFLVAATAIGVALVRNIYFIRSGDWSKACHRAILAIWNFDNWLSCAV